MTSPLGTEFVQGVMMRLQDPQLVAYGIRLVGVEFCSTCDPFRKAEHIEMLAQCYDMRDHIESSS